MLSNKDLNSFITILKPILEGVIAIKIPNEKNSLTTNQIAKICKINHINCVEQKNIIIGNHYLINEIKPKRILISGSLYLIGKIRKYYLK